MKSPTHVVACRAFFLVAVPATLIQPVSAQAPKPAPPSLAPHTVVLPMSEGPNMVVGVHPVLPAKGTLTFWAPKPAELRRLEADMPKYLSSYYRQYIGASQGGKRLIMINGFSSSVASGFVGGKYDWHRSTVSVIDGGQGFFQATYNPDTHQFAGPHFNGLG